MPPTTCTWREEVSVQEPVEALNLWEANQKTGPTRVTSLFKAVRK